MYSSTDIAAYLGITPQTVRSRSEEFEEYLTESAKPGQGRQRDYQEADLEVMIQIEKMHKAGKHLPAIHAALKEGKRAAAPEGGIEIRERPTTSAIVSLREALDVAKQEMVRLQSAYDQEHGQRLLAEQLLFKAQEEIKALNREIGRLEAGRNSE